ncbi:MAG: hypothetical protein J5486_02190 [Bacteroidaceae bacterium]|nr:hypothetical protein [Bacteroidaceae bacterium]
MTAIQLNALNAQMWRDLGTIAEDEGMMRRVAKYLRRVVKEMTADPTLMTKDEFFQMLDEAEKGPSKRFDSVEELDQYIRNL